LNAWQIVIESRTSFRFRARFEAGLTRQECEETRARIRQRMNAILEEKEMNNVHFEIEEVDSLAIDPKSGKFRLVVREPEGVTSGRARHAAAAPLAVEEPISV
jgi:hypothetical protein